MKVCPKCNTAFDNTPKFCSNCGAALSEASQSALLITEQGTEEVLLNPAPPQETKPTPLPLQAREWHSEEYVRQSRKSVRKFLFLIAITSLLVFSFVWGLSFLHTIIKKAELRVKDSVMVMESDNNELAGVSRSGKVVKLKTESSLAAPSGRDFLLQRSADGTKCVFLDTENILRLFDGSRFTQVAENVQAYTISFDGSAVAYTNLDNDLFLYRRGKAQRVASRVAEGFCLSPDGTALAYVKEEGEAPIACFYNGSEKTIAKEVRPIAISDGGTYVYYISAKDVVYVQMGSNHDTRQKLSDSTGSKACFNIYCDQILINDGTNTYFSEKGRERVKIASVPLAFLAPSGMGENGDGSIYGIKDLKDRFYTAPGPEGSNIYHLSDRLELSSLIKNIYAFDLQKNGKTLLYCKNRNLYQIDLRKTEKGESKIAGNIKGYLVSMDGKRVLYVDDEGESWFVTLGREARRITADTIDTAAAVALESAFVYELEGSLYYTDGGKGSKISGLSDDVQSLTGNGYVVLVECKNGDVFISTNGKKYVKYIKK